MPVSRGSTVRGHTSAGFVPLGLQAVAMLQRAIAMTTSGFKALIRYAVRDGETDR